MNDLDKPHVNWKFVFVRAALTWLLLLTSTTVALGSPDRPHDNGNGGNQDKPAHGHHPIELAPVEQKGAATQPQHEIKAPKKGTLSIGVTGQNNTVSSVYYARGGGAGAGGYRNPAGRSETARDLGGWEGNRLSGDHNFSQPDWHSL